MGSGLLNQEMKKSNSEEGQPVGDQDVAPLAPRKRGPKVDAELTRRRKADIVRAAARLFDKVGYHGVNMEMIAEATGLKKPTLYYYIKSKDQILFEIHELIVDSMLRGTLDLIEAKVPAIEVLRNSVNEIFRLIHDHPGFVRAFFEHSREMSNENRIMLREKRQDFVDKLVAVVAEGMRKGELAQGEPRIVVWTVLGSANWAYKWYRPATDGDPEKLADQCWQVLRHGLEP